jgi:glucose/arabinose dehydrogenase
MHPRSGTPLPARPATPRGWRLLLPLLLLAASAAHAQVVPDTFTVETLATQLHEPCGFEFLPDGRVLFVEQITAQLRLFKPGTGVQSVPVMTVPGVNTGGERGLLGVAVDPEFPARPYVYLYYDVVLPQHIRIARYTLAGDLDGAQGGVVTADTSSRFDLIDDIPDAAANHNGGTLRFGIEGVLYASIGEDATPCAAQDSVSLRGVILRLRTSTLPPGPGRAFRAQLTPSDNPFRASADSNERLVAALGLRNPFRFQVDPATGQLLIGDVGENVREELDLLAPPVLSTSGPSPGSAPLGADFGWPYLEGTLDGAHRNTCGPIPGGLIAPVFDYDRTLQNGAAVISAGICRPFPGRVSSWPLDYAGDLFASDYYSGVMRRLRFSNGAWALAPPVPGQPAADTWGTGFNTVSDYRRGPDGALWFCRQSVNFAAATGSIGRINGPGAVPVGVGPPGPPTLALELRISPAHGSAVLGVTASGRVTLRIVDLNGRAVRTLLGDGIVVAQGAAETQIIWDGRDDQGVSVRPGMYLALLEAGGERAGVRIPFLR